MCSGIIFRFSRMYLCSYSFFQNCVLQSRNRNNKQCYIGHKNKNRGILLVYSSHSLRLWSCPIVKKRATPKAHDYMCTQIMRIIHTYRRHHRCFAFWLSQRNDQIPMSQEQSVSNALFLCQFSNLTLLFRQKNHRKIKVFWFRQRVSQNIFRGIICSEKRSNNNLRIALV